MGKPRRRPSPNALRRLLTPLPGLPQASDESNAESLAMFLQVRFTGPWLVPVRCADRRLRSRRLTRRRTRRAAPHSASSTTVASSMSVRLRFSSSQTAFLHAVRQHRSRATLLQKFVLETGTSAAWRTVGALTAQPNGQAVGRVCFRQPQLLSFKAPPSEPRRLRSEQAASHRQYGVQQ